MLLRVSAQPADAQLFLDDRRLINPYAAPHERDASEHELRVEATGYQTVKRAVRFDGDLEVVVALEATNTAREAPSAQSPPRHSAPPHGRETAPNPDATKSEEPKSENLAASDVSCDPPFYFDADGVKRYRRECLAP